MSSKPKGFIRKLPQGVIKLATPDLIAAQKQPVPTGQLEAIEQSFAGIPPPPTTKKEEELLAASASNPLLYPKKQPKKIPADTGASLPPPPVAIKKPLKYVKETDDFKQRKRTINSPLQSFINNNPLLKQYQDTQANIETKNPYLTDTEIYTPQTRRSFYRFIEDNYEDDFKLPPQVIGKIDEEACSKLGAAAGTAVEAFLYQKFVREYIRNASPYRGILVYHGLGSGKTCSAIAASEALYGTANKKIIVMTPASLRGNFMSEISFCGFRHFQTQNYWVEQPLIAKGGMTYMYARSVMSLSEKFLSSVINRSDETRRVLWIPNFSKPANYDSLTPQQKEDIRAQITDMIDSRITFIGYNGIKASTLKEYACNRDPETGERFFDNAVIVIDEIHNLTRLMQGEITQYITERAGKRRKIRSEPIVPGRWEPKLCGLPLNYGRAYLFYRLLTDARNSKIIGLSGTPIINFPDELGILANVLAGYTECVEFVLQSPKKDVVERVKSIIEVEPRIDIIRFKSEQNRYRVLLSTFQEGYEKAFIEDGNMVGVKYNKDAQEDIRSIFPRIRAALQAENIPISEDTFVSYPRLPSDPDEFKQEFIDTSNLSITPQNKILLQKRLTGLISYYKGSKEDYMPKITKDELVPCEMSDFQMIAYSKERIKEIDVESTLKDNGDAYLAVEELAKMKNPSSYRFRSRALCNFTFPESIKRPFPVKKDEENAEVDNIEDAQLTEIDSIPEVDLVEQEEVAEEEEKIKNEIFEEGESEGEADKEEAIDREKVNQAARTLAEEKAQEGGEEVLGEFIDEEDDEEDDKFKVMEEMNSAAQNDEELDDSIEKLEQTMTGGIKIVPKPKVVKQEVVEVKSEDVPEPKPEEVPVDVVAEEVKELEEEKAKEIKPGKISRILTYREQVVRAMNELEKQKDNLLKLNSVSVAGQLRQYSAKMDHILRRMEVSKGSNLVYSTFKTVEGLGVLGIALKANAYVEIKIEGGDASPNFSAETEASLRKGPGAKEKRFITFTGEGSRERRNLILNVFNGNFDKLPVNMRAVLEESGYSEKKNMYGDICWVIGITGAGAEGISLKCCRTVHIMEPYWNNVRLEQVKGRAVRICSHQDLPFKDRTVEIYTYYSVFSAEQKNKHKIPITIKNTDYDQTSDQKVMDISINKDKINKEILNLMKETAVDCDLNASDNDGVQCFNLLGRPDQYMFDPNLKVDRQITSTEFVEEERVKEDIRNPIEEVKEQIGEPARPRVDTQEYTKIKFKGAEYILKPKSDGLTFEMYDSMDTRFRKLLGTISLNPATGTFKGSKPVFTS